MPSRTIGPYRVLETLGTGGVGTVYRGVDSRTGETAAVKILSNATALLPRAARRMAREFATLEKLSHANVIKVYDTGVHRGAPYLAMELVDGLTLRHYLALPDEVLRTDAALADVIKAKRHVVELALTEGASMSASVDLPKFDIAQFGAESPSHGSDGERWAAPPALVRDLVTDALISEPVSEEPVSGPRGMVATAQRAPSEAQLRDLNRPQRVGRLKDSMLQLTRAIAYIHSFGLIHRDLKPSNVMVDETRTVRLMDFGLAMYLADEGAITADGRVVGTIRYMAPEQILGERLDARTDLYSLGVILYELLAGRPPFDARTAYTLWRKVLETEPQPIAAINDKCDRALSRVAQRLINKDPDDRFQTAEEVYEALIE